MEIFKLLGSVFIDNDKANASLSKTDTRGQKVAKSLGKMGDTAKKAGRIMAIGLGAAATGALALGTKVGNTADRLLDLEDISGMSTDSIQKWQNAAIIAGTSTEAVTNASDKFTKSLKLLDTATSKQSLALKDLGLSTEEITNMNADERMNALTTALQGVGDKTERARIGNDLFAGSWKELAPVVGLGVDALKDAKDNAKVFDKEDLNAANEFRVGMDEAKKTISNFAMELAVDMMPMLNKFINMVIDNMPKIKETIKKTFDVIKIVVDIVVKVFDEYLIPIFKIAFEYIETNWPTMKATFETVFDAIKVALSAVWEFTKTYLLPIFEGLFNFVKDNWPVFQATFETVFTAIGNAVSAVWDLLSVSLFPILEGVYNFISDHWGTMGSIFAGAFDIIGGAITTVINIFTSLIDKIETAYNWLVKFRNKENEELLNASVSTQSTAASPSGFGGITDLATASSISSSNTSTTNNNGVTIETMNVRSENDITEIARQLYNEQHRVQRGYGY
jgi:hypothetical protein